MKKLKLYQKTSCGVKLQTCEERQCLFELIPLKKRRMIPIFERLCPFYPMCCCWEPWWRRCPLRWYYDISCGASSGAGPASSSAPSEAHPA